MYNFFRQQSIQRSIGAFLEQGASFILHQPFQLIEQRFFADLQFFHGPFEASNRFLLILQGRQDFTNFRLQPIQDVTTDLQFHGRISAGFFRHTVRRQFGRSHLNKFLFQRLLMQLESFHFLNPGLDGRFDRGQFLGGLRLDPRHALVQSGRDLLNVLVCAGLGFRHQLLDSGIRNGQTELGRVVVETGERIAEGEFNQETGNFDLTLQ